jgi:Spy/CpxP family protein refolding chaperone
MKTKKVKTGLLATIFALTFIFATTADMFAQQGQGPGKGYKQGWQNDGYKCYCLKMLDLTEEQQNKIDELRLQCMKNNTSITNKMTEKKARLKTLTTADDIDMEAINATIDDITELKSQYMKNKVANKMNVRKLLTDKQKIIFDKHRMGKGFGKKCKGKGFGYGKGMMYRNCPGHGKGQGTGWQE